MDSTFVQCVSNRKYKLVYLSSYIEGNQINIVEEI